MKGSLPRPSQFREVYDHGCKAVGPHVVLFALRSGRPRAKALVGAVASRKVGNAVLRARAKRVMRAAIAPLREQLPADGWIVLVARHRCAAPQVRSQEIRVEIQELLNRCGML